MSFAFFFHIFISLFDKKKTPIFTFFNWYVIWFYLLSAYCTPGTVLNENNSLKQLLSFSV